jgi:hypothetical protein
MRLSHSQASKVLAGQSDIGDAAWLDEGGGKVLVAVIDGLGHGHEAAAAATACCEGLQLARGQALGGHFARCHEYLRRTRGAAVSMACIDLELGSLSWAGVGNVEGYFLHGTARERLLLKSGIVGYNMPELRITELPAGPGDLLIFATDGIGPDFTRQLDLRLDAADLAQSILQAHARGTDDALVWVGRLHE